MDFIRPEHLAESWRIIAAVLNALEENASYLNTVSKCEPQLGRRGLYATLGGNKDAVTSNMAMLWVLNLSDGKHSLLEIAERSNLPFAAIQSAAELLRQHDLLKPV